LVPPSTSFRGIAASLFVTPCAETDAMASERSLSVDDIGDCGSAWKKDPVSGVIGVEQGPLIPMV
jgi:hypothetical protein